eukprot:scaffold232256_cov23-Tisochrysis_lutea.AAC.1
MEKVVTSELSSRLSVDIYTSTFCFSQAVLAGSYSYVTPSYPILWKNNTKTFLLLKGSTAHTPACAFHKSALVGACGCHPRAALLSGSWPPPVNVQGMCRLNENACDCVHVCACVCDLTYPPPVLASLISRQIHAVLNSIPLQQLCSSRVTHLAVMQLWPVASKVLCHTSYFFGNVYHMSHFPVIHLWPVAAHLTVILLWPVAPPLQVKRGILSKLLAG